MRAAILADALPLVKALGSVLPTPDVPTRVVAAPFAAAAGNRAVVTIVIGVQQPAPRGGAGVEERMQLLSSAYDMNYRPRAVEPAEFDATRAADHRFDLPIDDLAPGAYLLRFEAVGGKADGRQRAAICRPQVNTRTTRSVSNTRKRPGVLQKLLSSVTSRKIRVTRAVRVFRGLCIPCPSV